MRTLPFLAFASAIWFLPPSAAARTWTDSTGKYTIEADLIGFDDEQVIVQRQDKELGAFPLDQLSEADRQYLKSKEATEIHRKNLDESQIWTMADGLKVEARLVDYAEADVTIQARRGKAYVNNILFDNLPPIYQKMLPKIIKHFDPDSPVDTVGVKGFARSLLGEPKTYSLQGVLAELENGDEYGVPFFLLSKQDQEVLRPGWEQWKAAKDDYKKQEDHAFRLQSQAAAYQRDRQIDRQIAVMNLNLQAIQAGLTSAWEVTLYPSAGNPMAPRWVVVPGRNSLQATDLALKQNPGFYAGPVRRVSR